MSNTKLTVPEILDAALASPDRQSISLLDSDFSEPDLAVPTAGVPSATPTRTPVAGTPAASPTAPDAAADAEFERQYGFKRSEMMEIVQERRETQTAIQFLQNHPEYIASPENWNAFEVYLRETQLPITPENLEAAYKDLTAAQALDLDPNAAPRTVRAEPAHPVARPAAAPALPVSTGLSDRGIDHSAVSDAPSLEQVQAEIEKLPLEQARAKMIQLMREEKQRRGLPPSAIQVSREL